LERRSPDQGGLEQTALAHAIARLVPEHYREVRERRERQADKILGAVNERLVKEVSYWSDRSSASRTSGSPVSTTASRNCSPRPSRPAQCPRAGHFPGQKSRSIFNFHIKISNMRSLSTGHFPGQGRRCQGLKNTG
jgi:hypothetical protein